jgi:hypothetical protein
MIKNYFPIILGLVCMFSLSCKKDPDTLNPGNIDDSKVVFVDTSTVEISTVLVDSLPTSGVGRMLSGSYQDPGLGVVTASSYFQLSLNNRNVNINDRENILIYSGQPVYDSLVLILNINYSYGDITKLHKFTVHQVNEIMTYKSGSKLYNSSSFSYNSTSLGTKSVYLINPLNPVTPSPEMRVTLNDPTLGPNLFNLAKSEDFHITTNEYFKELVKGLVIVPDPANVSILGYSLNPVMRLYYHDDADPGTVRSYDFVKKFSDIHFNRITNDRTSTSLSSLKQIYDEVPSSQSNNTSYMLTGINLFTKINFPHLSDIRRLYPNCYVSKAFLIIHPKVNSFDQNYSLPNQLILYHTDQTNYPGTILSYKDLPALFQVVNPIVYYATPENSQYSFEITDFISTEIANPIYSRKGLLLASPFGLSNIRAEKLAIAANNSSNKNVKLVIYLSVFNQ